MSELVELVLVCLVFILAGTVKGVIGLGLPTVSLALVTMIIDLPTAMALLLAPSLVTNLYQACVGGNARMILKKTGTFMLFAGLLVWFGAGLLQPGNMDLLASLLGLLLVVYALTSLAGRNFRIEPSRQRWAGPATGAINGFLTGMTGSFVVPGVLYLQSIGLTRDQLIQAMGILFTVSTLALGVSLFSKDLVSSQLGLNSVLAVVPAVAGMMLGSHIRGNLPEPVFRKVFFWALLLLGVTIIFGNYPGIP